MRRDILERDHTYLRTKDDIYFCVAGDLHTHESIFGQPYYIPRKTAETLLGTQIQPTVLIGRGEFCKFMDFLKPGEYPDFIKTHFKDYYYSPPMWPALMKVDRTMVVDVLDPNKGRQNIMGRYAGRDDLPVVSLLKLIKQFERNLYFNTGVTGSLLLHNDPSQLRNDIDLVIYGQSQILKSKNFSIEKCTNNGRFSFLDGDNLTDYLDIKVGNYPGRREQLEELSRRRWDTFFIDGTKVDLTFSSRCRPSLSSYDLLPIAKKSFTGRVTNISSSYFLPTILQLETENGNEKVVITSRGYICLFGLLDIIEVFGEEYSCKDGKESYTIINGNSGTYLSRRQK
jgi:predicted nucleotidyltransferase